MRRGETAKYVQQLRALPDLYTAFDLFAASLMQKCAPACRGATVHVSRSLLHGCKFSSG